ncbi:MAG: tripartite tricarboxylate transporter substrate binding protein [Burkholderiales bacterium]|nr:tripartite tricarboxylate transporter substrate binding protein [Burkholderiales bacterium]MDE2397845.1 tripartite tricarboxylate transporter substrate binding protein [Burkholderiales bacterium]MDE2457187.1 tripartite tricarboxylate transporter substrate binding protein [Burkholderiales bacterium]
MQRRHLLAVALAPLALPSWAQDWPTQPVHIVVPTGPGSSLDLIARALGDKLAARWGQAVVIDNKPGAGGLLGMDIAAKATDGHTVAIGFNGPIAFAPFLYRKMPYDPAKDLKPIVMLTSQPNVLAVNAAKVPARTVAEFVAWAKAQKGRVNYSSLGNGSSAHLTMELFKSVAGFDATHIPFNGSPPAAMALAQGEVDCSFMVEPALLPFVRNNKVRLLAVSSAQRPASLKDLPTLAESGYPAVESLAWNGLFAPASMPDAVAAKINADANTALRDPALHQAFQAQGLSIVGGSAGDFGRVIAADVTRWGPVIRKIGITLD